MRKLKGNKDAEGLLTWQVWLWKFEFLMNIRGSVCFETTSKDTSPNLHDLDRN